MECNYERVIYEMTVKIVNTGITMINNKIILPIKYLGVKKDYQNKFRGF